MEEQIHAISYQQLGSLSWRRGAYLLDSGLRQHVGQSRTTDVDDGLCACPDRMNVTLDAGISLAEIPGQRTARAGCDRN